jgi:hypothetical protein
MKHLKMKDKWHNPVIMQHKLDSKSAIIITFLSRWLIFARDLPDLEPRPRAVIPIWIGYRDLVIEVVYALKGYLGNWPHYYRVVHSK